MGMAFVTVVVVLTHATNNPLFTHLLWGGVGASVSFVVFTILWMHTYYKQRRKTGVYIRLSSAHLDSFLSSVGSHVCITDEQRDTLKNGRFRLLETYSLIYIEDGDVKSVDPDRDIIDALSWPSDREAIETALDPHSFASSITIRSLA